MADHAKPATTDTYANVLSYIDARLDDLAVALDPAVITATNLPTSAVRWSSASNKWQKWNGSAWLDLSSAYALPLAAVTPCSITVNSSSAALTITQTGTGNALVVENSTSPDSNPFVIDASGRVVKGLTASIALDGGAIPEVQFHTSSSRLAVCSWQNNANGSTLHLIKSRSTTFGTNGGTPANADVIGEVRFVQDDGTSFLQIANITAAVDGTPGTNDMPGRLIFSTTADGASSPTEALRIDSSQRVGIGSTALANSALRVSAFNTGATSIYKIYATGTAASDVTARFNGSLTSLGTANAAFTLPIIAHYTAQQGTIGASSTVTNQYGFEAQSSLTGATNNYGFYGNIAAAANRWNFYANGTAQNYFAGNVTANAALNQTPTRSTVAAGSTITLTTSTNHLLYDNAATAATLTINLPSASLTDGQTITIATRSAIAALTLGGGTIYGAPTTLAAGGYATFIYSSGGSAWFRKG